MDPANKWATLVRFVFNKWIQSTFGLWHRRSGRTRVVFVGTPSLAFGSTRGFDHGFSPFQISYSDPEPHHSTPLFLLTRTKPTRRIFQPNFPSPNEIS
jgi:hypothetical protein